MFLMPRAIDGDKSGCVQHNFFSSWKGSPLLLPIEMDKQSMKLKGLKVNYVVIMLVKPKCWSSKKESRIFF